jgi:hypothetical protein
MAEEERAWETRVARKTRKKQATAGEETETRGTEETGQDPVVSHNLTGMDGYMMRLPKTGR